MASFLLLYSTTDGHTVEICRRLQQVIGQGGHHATVVPIGEATPEQMESCDRIVIGASIRYGRHQPAVFDFIRRHHDFLQSRSNAFFTVNAVARKPEKRQPDTNPYLKKFLRRIAWKPQRLAVFAGKIDYPRYRWLDRNMIRFIMWVMNGPTDPASTNEFTDWNEVEAFGRALCADG